MGRLFALLCFLLSAACAFEPVNVCTPRPSRPVQWATADTWQTLVPPNTVLPMGQVQLTYWGTPTGAPGCLYTGVTVDDSTWGRFVGDVYLNGAPGSVWAVPTLAGVLYGAETVGQVFVAFE